MLTKLKTISTLSIVVGALGLLSVVTNVASLAVGTERIQAAIPTTTQRPEAALVRAEMNRATAAYVASWRTYTVVMVVLLLGVSVAMLVGGVLSLRRRERGRRLLGAAFVAAVPVELLRAVSTVSVSVATARITQSYSARLMRASMAPGVELPPGLEKVTSIATSGVVSAGMAMGLVVAIGWIAAQLVFFVVGAIYLRKPDVREAFQGEALRPPI